MSSDAEDRDLLGRLSTDPVAFETFYRRHIDRVIGFTARRVRDPADVADLVASTFVEVLTCAPSYDGSRGEPTAWLLGITSRLIANARRQRGRESAATARIAGRRLTDASDIERLEERIDAARTSQAVLDALGQLKPRAREALLLVGADGLTPGEAAAVLGISSAAFRMRLSGARRALDRAVAESSPQPRPRRQLTGAGPPVGGIAHDPQNSQLKEVSP